LASEPGRQSHRYPLAVAARHLYDSLDDLEAKSGPAFDISAILVCSLIAAFPPELVD